MTDTTKLSVKPRQAQLRFASFNLGPPHMNMRQRRWTCDPTGEVPHRVDGSSGQNRSGFRQSVIDPGSLSWVAAETDCGVVMFILVTKSRPLLLERRTGGVVKRRCRAIRVVRFAKPWPSS
jgi:hypothetical protein